MLDDWFGQVSKALAPRDLGAAVARLVDPGAARETVHWGRNYLYETEIETADGPIAVVVKQFRNQGARARWRRRSGGSKAQRSWRAALAFEVAGVPTASPVALIEAKDPEGPSYFVTRRLEAAIEARYVFRAANRGDLAEAFPHVDYPAFLERLGVLLRRMHEARLFHRDLSIGNVLLLGAADGRAWPGDDPALAVIDLNRVRHRSRPLTWGERTRDLCRLAIFRPEEQRALLRAYGQGPPSAFRWWSYKLYHHGFRAKIATKKGVRGWTGHVRDWFRPRRAHAHIPAAEEDASSRDKIVWDALSDQPHQHATRLEKLRVRLADAPSHARFLGAFLGAVPRIRRRYRALRATPPPLPRPWSGLGVCVRPNPAAPDDLLAALDDLGVENVLLRLHPWQATHDDEIALAAALFERGRDLTFALPQNRALVKDPARWRAAVEEIAERFLPYGRRFQVGQAINRSKWGVWRYTEYLELAAAAAEILRRHDGVEILGPAVIDFELHATAAVLNHPRSPVAFDILASLLYVDRRGAPENAQLGFDTEGKVALCRAIAETARHCGPRSWITEVNWPLWEGPHSPAGKSVSVDEASQADYLVRFYLLALGTGLVERVYWWQLVARGYGLIDPAANGSLRRRPSYDALATLARELAGRNLIGVRSTPSGIHLYAFDGEDTVVAAWSSRGSAALRTSRAPSGTVGQDGSSVLSQSGRTIALMPSVQYLHFPPGVPLAELISTDI